MTAEHPAAASMLRWMWLMFVIDVVPVGDVLNNVRRRHQSIRVNVWDLKPCQQQQTINISSTGRSGLAGKSSNPRFKSLWQKQVFARFKIFTRIVLV